MISDNDDNDDDVIIMENNMRCPHNLTASPKELRSLFGLAPMPSTGSTTPDHETNLNLPDYNTYEHELSPHASSYYNAPQESSVDSNQTNLERLLIIFSTSKLTNEQVAAICELSDTNFEVSLNCLLSVSGRDKTTVL